MELPDEVQSLRVPLASVFQQPGAAPIERSEHALTIFDFIKQKLQGGGPVHKIVTNLLGKEMIEDNERAVWENISLVEMLLEATRRRRPSSSAALSRPVSSRTPPHVPRPPSSHTHPSPPPATIIVESARGGEGCSSSSATSSASNSPVMMKREHVILESQKSSPPQQHPSSSSSGPSASVAALSYVSAGSGSSSSSSSSSFEHVVNQIISTAVQQKHKIHDESVTDIFLSTNSSSTMIVQLRALLERENRALLSDADELRRAIAPSRNSPPASGSSGGIPSSRSTPNLSSVRGTPNNNNNNGIVKIGNDVGDREVTTSRVRAVLLARMNQQQQQQQDEDDDQQVAEEKTCQFDDDGPEDLRDL